MMYILQNGLEQPRVALSPTAAQAPRLDPKKLFELPDRFQVQEWL